jgi:hypothetical protein
MPLNSDREGPRGEGRTHSAARAALTALTAGALGAVAVIHDDDIGMLFEELSLRVCLACFVESRAEWDERRE